MLIVGNIKNIFKKIFAKDLSDKGNVIQTIRKNLKTQHANNPIKK